MSLFAVIPVSAEVADNGLTYKIKNGEPVQIITEEDSVLKGDVNLDKTVNIKDATAIQKHIANMVYLSDISLEAADYNEDGFVNIKDATAIQKMLAGFAE